jgi:hypothetical protein
MVIFQQIIDHGARGVSSRLAAGKDMADLSLAERHQDKVSQNWAATFFKRRSELKVKFNRKYDYSKALFKDPEVIQDWVRLVDNTKTRYGIEDEDMYNYDKSGFMMGMILTIQQGSREWATVIHGASDGVDAQLGC